tara:strand:+ start:3202 stop:3543 length:342 start_codon:yes stop_codon:yes gene_type:complete
MSRNENEKIDIDIPDPAEYTTVFFTAKGVRQSKETNKSFAKIRTNANTNYRIYYIKYGNGDIFDPWGMHANKINSPSISFRKVGKKTFQHYLKYLETRRSAFLLKAKRELVNE